ncbi:YciK family oxidoreductase [Psychrosphaera saromensis]|uniref:YciK family oxidoreductase n=1 Tax=Psychrosphaera saromensis TaxID=716813 RepID=A0A2S7UXI4_9GAMM|nr:YciK family oxidoreductase [Psychrosphaera saromensis]PQJ54202.1 YciK family oxidoreductase [Psychrosphaera saromensis]GHB75098.1 YciK family oxidoreductase [Psychrosphaera saromensis]GLQ12701.1 YciK family oxidoreductase [Psychrosphaera saromensis]
MKHIDFQTSKNELNNKVILVTGAGSGIGRQAAITYAQHGAEVILLGKTTKKLEAVYDEIVEAGYKEPSIIPLDLKGATVKNYQDMASTIISEYGKLDGLLNNASILGALSPLQHVDEGTFDDVMKVNFKGTFFLTQALIPALKLAPNASVVFTSSGVGKKGRAFWGAYAFSKFATEGLMQTMADEFENTNIRTNCVNPGATKTNMRARAYPSEDVRKLKLPEQLMPSYLYLMSDESKDVNGQSLDVQPK